MSEFISYFVDGFKEDPVSTVGAIVALIIAAGCILFAIVRIIFAPIIRYYYRQYRRRREPHGPDWAGYDWVHTGE